MANEILPGPNTGNGNYECVFYFPIASGDRIKARGADGAQLATNVVPTPSASAPAWVKFTAQEVSDLDAGNSMFLALTISQAAGESDAAMVGRVQTMYADRAAPLLVEYQQRFKHMNKRVNAS
jgi:hypothetical protein